MAAERVLFVGDHILTSRITVDLISINRQPRLTYLPLITHNGPCLVTTRRVISRYKRILKKRSRLHTTLISHEVLGRRGRMTRRLQIGLNIGFISRSNDATLRHDRRVHD